MTQFRSQDPNKLDMNRMVSDASRRVREFKRTKSAIAENLDSNGQDKDIENEASNLMDLSSIGEALEWSPKNTPKKAKKKSFVRLSSYENQCFSNIAAGGM